MTEVPKKKLLDLAEAFSKKIPCQTSVGVVYARPLTSGKWSTVSASDEAPTIGEAAIRALTGTEEKADDEAALSDNVFSRLSPGDIQDLASSVAKANRLGDLPAGITPIEGLGELILKKRAADLEAAKQLREKILSSAFAGLETSTAQRLRSQLDGMDSLRAAIKQSNIPVSNHLPMSVPKLHIPDLETTPMGRAATASELTATHVAKVADQTADLVLKMSELTDTFIVKVIPEWRQQLEAEQRAAAESNAQAVENLRVATQSLRTAQRTLWVTVGIAVATMAVQIGQYVWSERSSAEERAKQEETARLRHEATIQVLREQLSAQQQLIAQQAPMPPRKNEGSDRKK